MLETVRKPTRAKRTYQVVGYGLLGLICLSFAFVGLTPDQSSFSGGGSAAVVNNEVIPLSEFQQAVDRIERQYGDAWTKMPAAQRQMIQRSLRERTLNELVGTEVLYQSAERNGFFTPKSAVLNELVNLPYFQEDGQFSKERYRALLEANRLNPAAFEANIRKQVALGQVRDTFFRSLKKPEVMKSLEEQARGTKMNLEFVQFNRDQLEADKIVDEARVQKYLASEDGAARVKSYYNANKSEFETPPQLKARHILIKSDGSPEIDKKAKEKLAQIQEGLNPQNFASRARESSEDIGSKEKGGDLGYFKKGVMVPEFEEAAFKAKTGEIVGPVKTGFGYHLILVEGKKDAQVQSLEDSQAEIARRLLAQDVRDDVIADLEKTVKENPSELNGKIRDLNLKWETTGDFDLSQSSIPRLGNTNDVVSEALALQNQGELVPKLIRSGGQIYIVKLKSLEKAKGAVASADLPSFSSEAMDALNTWAQDLKEDARVQINGNLLVQ